jgi:hypothetical protein
MSLLIIPKNITRLSELEIDVDKDWQNFGITNLKELDNGMHRGDILVHDGHKIVKISTANIGDELTSEGHGQIVNWKAPPALEE